MIYSLLEDDAIATLSGRATHIRHGWVCIQPGASGVGGVRWWDSGAGAWVDRTPSVLGTTYTGLIWFSDADVWCSDDTHGVAHWDGITWSLFLSVASTGYTVNGISGLTTGAIYVVGTKTAGGTYSYTSGGTSGFAAWTDTSVGNSDHQGELWTGSRLWVSSPDHALDLISATDYFTPPSTIDTLPDFRRRTDGTAFVLGRGPAANQEYGFWSTTGTSWSLFKHFVSFWLYDPSDLLTMHAMAINPTAVSLPNDYNYWAVGQYRDTTGGTWQLPVWITNYTGSSTSAAILSSSPLEQALLDVDVINGQSGTRDAWVCGYRVGDSGTSTPERALIYHLSGSTWTDRSIDL